MSGHDFVYTPLNRTTQDIRLLELSHKQTVMSCNLTVYDVDQCPPYIALSYVWGNDESSYQIEVEGRPFRVRSNLWSALRELARYEGDHTAKHFWIDSICINQGDNRERTHQVQMMARIYSKATIVIAWLGVADGNLDLAMRILCRLPNKVGQHYIDAAVDESSHLQAIRFSENTAQQKQALKKLFMNRYWERLWVVQELILAKSILFMCGHLFFSWDQLKITYRWPSSWSEVNRLIEAKESPLVEASTLPGLMASFSFRKCSDVRDKVYALLGLVEPVASVLEVDYDISTTELFYRTVSCYRLLSTKGSDNAFYQYEHLGQYLNVPASEIQVQKYMHELMCMVRCPVPGEGHGQGIKQRLGMLLGILKIDDGSFNSVDEAYEALVRDPQVSGGPRDLAGWRSHEREIKLAFRVRRGELWGVLREERLRIKNRTKWWFVRGDCYACDKNL